MPQFGLPSIDDLTPEQHRIRRLPAEGVYLVFGPPGTGKTIIALQRAVRLLQENLRPVLIVYNRLLKSYCRQLLEKNNVDAGRYELRTFHSWFNTHFNRLYAINAPETEPFVYNWEQIFQILAANEIVKKDEPIIVDEGQDLPKEFYQYLRLHFNNIMVFADENQKLDERTNSTIEQICIKLHVPQDNSHVLKTNMRNTLQIAKVADHFYTGTRAGRPELPEENEGNIAYLIKYFDVNYLAQRIVRHASIHTNSLIGVVFPKTDNLQNMREVLQPLCWQKQISLKVSCNEQRDHIDFEEAGILLLNLQAIKGLEFDSVLLADLQDHLIFHDGVSHRMRLYVACARARKRLYLFHEDGVEAPLLNDMPDEENLKRYELRRPDI